MKDKLLVSFSGGETSGYMLWWILKNWSSKYEIKVVFANTGQENEETLLFVQKCSEYFNIEVIWVEAVVNPENRKGTTHKVVNLEWCTQSENIKHAYDVLNYKQKPRKLTDENQEKLHNGRRGLTPHNKGIKTTIHGTLYVYNRDECRCDLCRKAMSEQNKALLRYNYLLSVTADAQGDFSKTSNSWANQVRVLALQWDSFKATLGGAFINVLTPVFQRPVNISISP